MRTPPPEPQALPPTYQRGYQHVGHPEPAWLEDQQQQGLQGYDPMMMAAAAQPPTAGSSVLGETTPLRGSAPSTAPSSVGRPGRGGGGGGAGVVGVGMGPGHLYRPYVAPHKIRRGFCLSLFVAINALTVLSALSVAVAEVLSVVYHRLSPQAIAIRVYGVVLALLVVFCELGWTKSVRDSPFLQSWLSRGAIYAFVGLLALEQHAEKTAAEGVVNFYNFCAGLSLIALGVLYFVMGVFCLKRVRDRKNAEYTILRSQAELDEAMRLQVESAIGKAAYDHGGGYSSVVI